MVEQQRLSALYKESHRPAYQKNVILINRQGTIGLISVISTAAAVKTHSLEYDETITCTFCWD